MTNDEIKRRTIELYDQLPQDEEGRKARIDIRDQVIELNYKFFGYIASHTYVSSNYATYEDKFQSTLMHFCECWWWYKYAAKYRTDLSFAVFFKPRISEMVQREFAEVKYSIERTLKMEAGDQLGKHWTQVNYDDLKNVNLSPEKLNSLKAIFGALYPADLGEHEIFLSSESSRDSSLEHVSDRYNSITSLLIHDMILLESKLDESELKKMSRMYSIDIDILKRNLPYAERLLYKKIQENLDLKDSYEI